MKYYFWLIVWENFVFVLISFKMEYLVKFLLVKKINVIFNLKLSCKNLFIFLNRLNRIGFLMLGIYYFRLNMRIG